MATIDDLNAAIVQANTDAQAVSDRVAALTGVPATGGVVTQDQLQTAIAAVQAVSTILDAIASTSVVTPSFTSVGQTIPVTAKNPEYTYPESVVPSTYFAPTTNLTGTGPHNANVVVETAPVIPVGGPAYSTLKPADQSVARPASPPVNEYPPTVVP